MSNGNLAGFDANTVPPQSFDVLPAGEYEAVIVNSSFKPTANGNGKYLELELQVLNGEYQNRKIWDRLNLFNPNEKAVQIAKGTLSAICRAINVLTPNDSSELHNKPLRVKVAVKKSEECGDKNEVKAYKPRNAGPSTSAYSAPVDPPSGGQPGTTATPW